MKMIFNANERISITSDGCETKYMKKQDFADYLTENDNENDFLERAVILNHLPLVNSIRLQSKKVIVLYPTYVRISVSKELYKFLYNFLISD